MKKVISSLAFTALMLGSSTGLSAFANENTSLSGNNIQEDYKTVMNEVKNEINSYQVTSPEQVEIYKKFKSMYSQKELENLNKNLDAFDQKKVNEKLKSTKIANNQRKAIVLGDGSMVIIGNKTGPIEDGLIPSSNEKQVTTYANIKNGTSGYKYYSTFYQEIWGIIKQAEVYNRVDFQLYTNKAVFLGSSPAGTRAFIPATVEVADHSTSGSGTRTLVNTYDYNATVSVAGNQLGNRYVSLGNTIKVISNVGNSVNYTATPSYKGF
ncbi:hypothetical protein [Macrococcus bovicus]|uniref:Uncharacterized protein n=1 Tax=Macrococcus bovicus TaxID=69968 RepID=A0A4R6BV71_9STAP|nr:hypothetical protein [Macrococcus bovicus]TDM12170.1 hypothetical protein ERX55_11145 [Macrococcus bovicus]